MSDAPQDTAPPATDSPVGTPPLNFLGQYIKDMSFEAPLAPDIFNALREQSPDMEVTIDANARQIDGSIFEVSVSVSLNAKVAEKTAFILELVYGCIAQLNPQLVPQEYAHSVLLIEVPRHLFPFVRQVVATTTAAGGFPPVMLQMINFADLYRRKFGTAGEPGQTPAPAAPAMH